MTRFRVGDRIRPRRSRTGRIWRVTARDRMPDGTVWIWLAPVGDENNHGGGRPGRLGVSGGVRRLRRLEYELDHWEHA